VDVDEYEETTFWVVADGAGGAGGATTWAAGGIGAVTFARGFTVFSVALVETSGVCVVDALARGD